MCLLADRLPPGAVGRGPGWGGRISLPGWPGTGMMGVAGGGWPGTPQELSTILHTLARRVATPPVSSSHTSPALQEMALGRDQVSVDMEARYLVEEFCMMDPAYLGFRCSCHS